MSTIVYDAGALVAAEDGEERMWALHKRALARGIAPVVPAAVLVEVWRGGRRQHRLGQFVQSCEVEGLREEYARATGVRLSAAAHGVVDASVVECALRRGYPCVTGNRSHLVQRRVSSSGVDPGVRIGAAKPFGWAYDSELLKTA